MKLLCFAFALLAPVIGLGKDTYLYPHHNAESVQTDAPYSVEVNQLINKAKNLIDSDFNLALATAKEALRIATKSNDHNLIAISFQCLGEIETFSEEHEASGIQHLHQALEIFKELKDNINISLTLATLGEMYSYTDSTYNDGINYLYESIRIAEETNDKVAMARVYNNLGVAFANKENWSKAIEYFNKSYQINVLNKTIDGEKKQVIDIGNIGVGLVALNMLDSAYRTFELTLSLANKLKNERLKALSLVNIASVHEKREEYIDAIRVAHSAIPIAEKIDHMTMLNLLYIYLGRSYLALDNKERGNEYLNKALNMALQIGDKSTQRDVYEAKYKFYSSTKNFKKALEALELFKQINDSLKSVREAELITRIESEYQAEIKDNFIEKLSAENEVKEIQKNNVLIISISILIIALSAIFVYVKRQKYKNKLSKLSQELELKTQRDKIARNLHDGLGGQLSSIIICVNKELNKTNSSNLLEIESMANRAISELRDALWEMNNTNFTLEDLEQRINNLIWQYRKIDLPFNFLFNFSNDQPSQSFNALIIGNLYKITQEALHNSLKHSGGDTIKVLLSKTKNMILLSILDNGKGFTVNSNGNNYAQYGLQNMKWRAEQLGGEYLLSTSQEIGTEVKVLVTLN